MSKFPSDMENLNGMKQKIIEKLTRLLAKNGNQTHKYNKLVEGKEDNIHQQIAQRTIDHLLDKASQQSAQNTEIPFVELRLSASIKAIGDKVNYLVHKTIRRDWDVSWQAFCKIAAEIVSQACRVKVCNCGNETYCEHVLTISRKAGRGGYYIRVPRSWLMPANIHEHQNQRRVAPGNVLQATAWQPRNLSDPNNLCSASGGYFVGHSYSERSLIDARKDQRIPPESVIVAVNRLQCCQWTIHQELFKLLRQLPQIVHNLPKSIKDSVEEFDSRKRLLLTKQHAVNEFPQSFFIPYKIDYRGRLYTAEKHLFVGDPQGSDIDKAVLQFESERPLGRDGYKWLCKYLATMQVARTFQESIDWVEENKGKIQRSIQNIRTALAEVPITENLANCLKAFWSRFHDECDGHEFTFLATCFEVVDCWRFEEDGHSREDFTSKLPIRIDGKCNGFQHIAALTRKTIIAQNTNVVVQDQVDKPCDFYSFIAQKIHDVLETNYQQRIDLLENQNPERFTETIETFQNEINDFLTGRRNPASIKKKCKKFLKSIGVAENLTHLLSDIIKKHQTDQVDNEQVVQFLLTAISSSQDEIKNTLENYYQQNWRNDIRFRTYVKKILVILGYGAGLRSPEIRERTMEIFLGNVWKKAFDEYQQQNGQESSLKHCLTDGFLEDLRVDPNKRQQADVFLELVDWKLEMEIGEFRSLIKQLTKVLNKLDSGVCFQTPDHWFLRFAGRKGRKSKLRFNEFVGLPIRVINNQNEEQENKKSRPELVYRRFEFDYQKFDNRKKSTRLLANYIHSLDAYHLRRVLHAACPEVFKGGLMAVHDNVGTHAGDMEQLHQIVLKEFKSIYSQSPLRDFVQFYRQRLNWMKSGFIFRGDGNWEEAVSLAEELESILCRIEQLDSDVTWFGENDLQVSQYLFS